VSRLSNCAYCSAPATTRDHVPTKKLFPSPRPSDLITVPSCESCNNRLSPDEEYFVHVLLSLREADTPTAWKLRNELFAKERTARRLRMSHLMLSTIKRVRMVTAGGLHLGYGHTFEVDLDRFDRVVEKVARGLWFAEFQEQLPQDRIASVLLNPPREGQAGELIEAVFQNGSGKDIGPGIFEYRIAKVPDVPGVGACGMIFFEATLVMCSLLRPESLGARGTPTEDESVA